MKMGVNFDKWTFLKLVEVGFVISCLVCKRVTDDEESRLFLYLQKLSREWSLLNKVTWDTIGSAVADATYGGYVIITSTLFIGRLFGELPTTKRITEIVFLLLGAFLFVVLGGLELASIESIPNDLIDNAAVIGTLSLVTAALFLLDLAGPKQKKSHPVQIVKTSKAETKTKPETYAVEKEIVESATLEIGKSPKVKDETVSSKNGLTRNGGYNGQNGVGKNGQNGYKKMKDKTRRFDIYGKDYESDTEEELTQVAEEHSPVWSKIKKGQYGKYDIVVPSFWYGKEQDDVDRPPSTPGDPGYVQYTAKTWGQPQSQKTPRGSPTEV